MAGITSKVLAAGPAGGAAREDGVRHALDHAPGIAPPFIVGGALVGFVLFAGGASAAGVGIWLAALFAVGMGLAAFDRLAVVFEASGGKGALVLWARLGLACLAGIVAGCSVLLLPGEADLLQAACVLLFASGLAVLGSVAWAATPAYWGLFASASLGLPFLEFIRRGMAGDAGAHAGLLALSMLFVGAVLWKARRVSNSALDSAARIRELEAIVAQGAEANARMEHMALHDPLTGLANRRAFDALFDQLVATGRRSRSRFAIVAVDLDDFKLFNDTRGHVVGDMVLQAAARRLSLGLRQADYCARVGGDEFQVLLEGASTRQTVIEVVEKMRRMLSAPLLIDGEETTIRASFGWALFPDDASDALDLVRIADQRLYEDKRRASRRREEAEQAVHPG